MLGYSVLFSGRETAQMIASLFPREETDAKNPGASVISAWLRMPLEPTTEIRLSSANACFTFFQSFVAPALRRLF
jgi:hypothetical protein